MFNRYQNIFRSRWRAVTWAMGVCLTAYCTVPAPEESASGPANGDGTASASTEQGEDAALRAVARAAAAARAEDKPQHVNPWALKKDQPPQE